MHAKRFFLALCAVMALFVSTALPGCSGGSGSDAAVAGADDGTGTAIIGLTDGQGDFISYSVDVTSITLKKKNGAVINALPLETRVDFAQYVDMTEFLTAATVPLGAYVEATLTLDFTNAEILVEDASGDAIGVDLIQNSNGDIVTTMEMTVPLDETNMIVAPGVPAHLTLDFDLAASNSVAFDQGGLTVVTVEPVLLADVNPQAPKIHRLRGPLAEVYPEKDMFSVIIRPFIHLIDTQRRDFGTLIVETDENTVYEINGDLFEGALGLEALAAEPKFTAVVVFGDLKFAPARFEARHVYAGSNVPGGNMDGAAGNVISRNNDIVTIKGAVLMRADGQVEVLDTITVRLADTTTVSRQLSPDQFGIDDISVGQRITVLGEFTDQDPDADLDATNGHAHMLLTGIGGTVVQAAPDDFAVDLESIDRHGADLFDFAGTGADAQNDADKDNYEIDTDTLDISGLALSTPVRICGFVAQFGQAPADFLAHTIMDVTQTMAVLRTDWEPPSATAFADVSDQGLVLDLTGAGIFHHIIRAWVKTDLTGLAGPVAIKPDNGQKGMFAIFKNNTMLVRTSDFGVFADALANQLDDNALVLNVTARGTFDDASLTILSNTVVVILE